ncbi:hypothetical protein SDJN02_10216, partial [Cucurbita argyrosperma subsp. argyrosperma]
MEVLIWWWRSEARLLSSPCMLTSIRYTRNAFSGPSLVGLLHEANVAAFVLAGKEKNNRSSDLHRVGRKDAIFVC